MIDNIVKLLIEPCKEVYYNQDSKYGIYYADLLDNLTPQFLVKQHPIYNTITLVGVMPKLNLYKKYTVNCKESTSKYGKQYEFISFEIKKANTSEEQIDFLFTILTPLQVESIKLVYDKPVDEIINNTFDYKLVKGIGKKSYLKIRKKVLDNYIFFNLLAELGKYGITYKQVSKLYEIYEDVNLAVQAVKDNPYVLTELPGVGFKRADQIALNMGIEKNSTIRILACAEYLLNKESELGHTWSNIDEIQNSVKEYIGEDIFINKTLKDYILYNNKFILIDNFKLTTKLFYHTEQKIADKLCQLKENNSYINIDVNKFINEQEQSQNFLYDEKQKEIFYEVIKNNLFILSGAAGCGKSVSVNGLLNMFDKLNITYALMSPSAKAAKVLENYTGREATTIHRGLEWTPDGFAYNKYNKLPYDVIVLDECSMVGIFLFNSLLNAIRENTKLILVGDPFQIPSIEPGSILDDMLQSNLFANVQLIKVFRQAEKSGIIKIATATRNGQYFVGNNENSTVYYGDKKDTIFIPCNKDNIIDRILKSYNYLLSKGYTDNDIIVLLPSRKNIFGTFEINKLLQKINNPHSESKKEYKCGFKNEITFRENDKVIHTKNNYKAIWHEIDKDGDFIETNNVGIFNGDIGRIYKIIEDEDKNTCIYVDYGNKFIKYENEELEQLEHAWSLTIHKYQGSQSKVVILGIDSRNYYMSKRNLIYTGITRCSELLILCCDPKIINMGIDNNEIPEKRTFLKDLLIENTNKKNECKRSTPTESHQKIYTPVFN